MIIIIIISLYIKSKYLLIKITSNFFLYQIYQTTIYFHQFHKFSLIYKIPVNTIIIRIKIIHIPISSIPNPFFHFNKKYL